MRKIEILRLTTDEMAICEEFNKLIGIAEDMLSDTMEEEGNIIYNLNMAFSDFMEIFDRELD